MGHPAISVLTCVIAAYTIAIAIYPAFRYRNASNIVTVTLACVGVTLCLLIIPQAQVVLRAMTAVLLVDLFFRLIDFARQSRHGKTEAIGWGTYCRFLIPFPLFLVVFGQKDRRRLRDERSMADVLRLILGSAGVAIGFMLLFAANEITAVQTSFVLGHITRLLIFALTVESLAQALCGLEHLVGFDTRPIVDRAFVSRTPADFWQRFNSRIQSWWYLNVFVPSDGRHAPIRGVWATFLASAILHEVAFTIATSRITGNQLIFFLLQAPAVLASPWLNRVSRAGGAAIAHAVTILWIGMTSIFFFNDLERVFTFFYNG